MGKASTRKKLKKLLSALKEQVKTLQATNSIIGGVGGSNGFSGVIVNVEGKGGEDFRLADQ